jgi:hypothetical protein
MIGQLDPDSGCVEYVMGTQSIKGCDEVICIDGVSRDKIPVGTPVYEMASHSKKRVVGSFRGLAAKDGQLIQLIQWDTESPDRLVQVGWKLARARLLFHFMFGFHAVEAASRLRPGWDEVAARLDGMLDGVKKVWIRQDLVELSIPIAYASPNTIAVAYQEGVIDDDDLKVLTEVYETRQSQWERYHAQLLHAASPNLNPEASEKN